MDNCIFCKIAEGKIPSKKVFESRSLFAFHDIAPRAPVHVLIIPRTHIPTLNELEPAHCSLAGEMVLAAKKIAQELKIAGDGYRLVFNCGKNSGMEVFHLHLHLLGGRPMEWPPA
jgi:histidine triad (HIT) family protein